MSRRAAFAMPSVPGLSLRAAWARACRPYASFGAASVRQARPANAAAVRASAMRGSVSLASAWVGTVRQPLRRAYSETPALRAEPLREATPAIVASARRPAGGKARGRAEEVPIDEAYGQTDLNALDDDMESPRADTGAGRGDVRALAFASDFHAPVMWEACVESLVTEQVLEEGGVLVDCTLGGGGHTSALLAALFEAKRPTLLVSIDQDFKALRVSNRRVDALARRLEAGEAAEEPAGAGAAEEGEEEGEGGELELDEEGRPQGGSERPESVPVRHRVELRGPHAMHSWQSVHANFRDLPDVLAAAWEAELEARGAAGAPAGGPAVRGVLMDLGMSSHHINDRRRGFSFARPGPLDMRMDPTSTELTASYIVNRWPVDDLKHLLYRLGEEPRAGPIAREVAKRRPLRTTVELADAIKSVVPWKEQNKSLARVFQALRIHVNDELAVLERALSRAHAVLAPQGRLAVISYHSLEDRRVKHVLKTGNLEGRPVHDMYGNLLSPWRLVARKPLAPSDAEIFHNSRARSARLRVAERSETDLADYEYQYSLVALDEPKVPRMASAKRALDRRASDASGGRRGHR